MVNVLAHCNGMPLELAPTSEYSLRIATKNQIPDEMEMFYGEETETGINWIESDNDPNTQNNVNQSEWVRDSNSRFTIGMECFPKKLGWVNCDYFTKDNTQEKTNPCLIATTPPNGAVSYTHLRAHETVLDLVCRLLLEKKNTKTNRKPTQL